MSTLTDIYSWGDPHVEFKGTTNKNLMRIAFFGILFLGSIYSIGAAIFGAINDGFLGGLPFAILPLTVGGFAGFHLWRHVQARRETIGIYDKGIARRTGDNIEMLAWEEMVESSQNLFTQRVNFIPVYKKEVYRVKTKDGATHLFRGSIPDANKVGAILHRQVARQVLPGMIERYNAGETLAFGNLKINKSGVHRGNKSMGWGDLKGMSINNGFLSFKKEGKWLNWGSMQINNTPNFVALLDLLEAITGMKFG